MSSTKIKSTFSPGVLSILPMIYVGWSDSVLSPSEIKLIHQHINSLDFLTSEDKSYLIGYMDPVNPPTDVTFKIWLDEIKKNAAALSNAQKTSLLELGIALAKAGVGQKDYHHWDSPKTKAGLSSIQDALGIAEAGSSDVLLPRIKTHEIKESPGTESSFDVVEMKNLLDGEYIQLMDKIRKLLRDPLFDLSYEHDKDIYRLRILHQMKLLAKQGLSSFSFPKKYGGGEKKGDHIAVFEMLAYGDLSLTVKFGVQFGLFGGALFQLGTEIHHRRYLEAMHKGELLGCFAMTETGHGSNVKGLETTATYDHQLKRIIINSPGYSSGKEYIGNALHCQMAVVFAQLHVQNINHGVHAILVPIRNERNQVLPGIAVKDSGYKMGLNGVDNGRFWFNQVVVPVENLLNRFGSIDSHGHYTSQIENPSKRFFTMLGALVVGRISVGLAANSASKKALTIAIKYSLKRRQFGLKEEGPEFLIMDYPTHQARLIPLLAKTYAYHFSLRKLARQYNADDGTQVRKIETIAAGLKSVVSWHCTETIQECREACGGKGYLQENQLPNLKADTDIFTTFEGDNTVLMQLVSKGLMTEFKQSFHDEGAKAVIRYLLKKVGHVMNENNPLQKRNTDLSHLTSDDFIQFAFEYRYEKTLITLSKRMRKYLKRGVDPSQAFLRTQVHLIELAHAFIDQLVIKNFKESIENTARPKIKDALLKLYHLYALDNIYKNRGWYLENDFMEGNKSKAIRRVRSKLIQVLRQDIHLFIEAFGIPDELLEAPIALSEWS